MNKTELFAAIAEILEVSADGWTGTEVLETLGNWDSLSIISFMAMADSEMKKAVNPEKLLQAKTLNDLASLVDL